MARAVMCMLALAAALIGPAHAQDGRWLRAQSRNFTIYSEVMETSTRRAVADLEALDTLLRLITGARELPPAPLDVYMLRNTNSLREVAPRASEYLGGFYTMTPEQVAAFAIFQDRGYSEAEETLYHEYAHHFMYRYFPTLYPSWYSEGFAEYVSTVRIRADGIEAGHIPSGNVEWLLSGDWLPFERILTSSAGSFPPEETALFYAQSWLTVHYIFASEARKAALRAYFDALRNGDAPVAAFSEAFGMSVQAFETELRRYGRGRLNVTVTTGLALQNPRDVALTRLAPQMDDLLLPAVGLRLRGVRGDDAEDAVYVANVRRLATQAGADGFARELLAREEIYAGENERARAVLRESMTAGQPSVETQYLMGLSHLMDARQASPDQAPAAYEQARRHFVSANRIDRTCPRSIAM